MIYRVKKLNTNKKAHVYFLFNNDELVYVGSTAWLRNRISQHRHEKEKTFTDVYYITIPLKDRDEVEMHYIELYKAKYNKRKYPYYIKNDQTITQEMLRTLYD
jgi:predicted GIY-YIG superfamily endonuclease